MLHGFLTWLEEQKNVPSRADHYAMRICQAVNGGAMDDYLCQFKPAETLAAPGDGKPKAIEAERQAEKDRLNSLAWKGWLGAERKPMTDKG